MALNLLPIEINANIAKYLEDQDLCHFSLVCQATHDALCDRSPLWKQLFSRNFDLVPRPMHSLKSTYQHRKKLLRRGALFMKGNTTKERQCLSMIVDLILESYAAGSATCDADGIEKSLNLDRVKDFTRNHNLLSFVLSPNAKYSGKDFDPVLRVVQIMLAHLQLEHAYVVSVWGFPDSQKAVYESVRKEPIFQGPLKGEINMLWVAHVINFFKYHMMRKEEATLYGEYQDLRKSGQGLKAWRRQLKGGVQKLGRCWKGTYAFLNSPIEQSLSRRSPAGELFLDDGFEERNGGIQSLQLDFTDPAHPHPWPKVFEHHLNSIHHSSADYFSDVATISSSTSKKSRCTTRAQHRHSVPSPVVAIPGKKVGDSTPLSFHFSGCGIDEEAFAASGWLNPLPPQNGIDGWMRWTMMKFFLQRDSDVEDGNDAGDQDSAFDWKQHVKSGMGAIHAIDEVTQLWAYEGVVLPGGELVVGRWWDPESMPASDALDDDDDDGEYSGPFLFWCVD